MTRIRHWSLQRREAPRSADTRPPEGGQLPHLKLNLSLRAAGPGMPGKVTATFLKATSRSGQCRARKLPPVIHGRLIARAAALAAAVAALASSAATTAHAAPGLAGR